MKKTKQKRKAEDRTPAQKHAERIINELIDSDPRLRAAREASRRAGLVGNESIVQSTLTAHRQRLKK
jgi:hypothetical protein